MPAVPPPQKCFTPPPVPNTMGMNRIVLTQMLACGFLGWGIFAMAVDRWLPTERTPELPSWGTVTQQVSTPSTGAVSIKSAQFKVGDRDQTR